MLNGRNKDNVVEIGQGLLESCLMKRDWMPQAADRNKQAPG